MKRAGTIWLLILMLLLSWPSVALSASARPQGIQVLYYSRNVMERAASNHMNPRFARTGDYVPTMRLTVRELAGCLTAVNWNSRHWVAENRILTIDFWDARERRWERHTCRASDWQQRRHSTGNRQRFEVDYETARSVNAVPNNTVARLIAVGPRR
jgi:hypothetical protein